MTLQDLSLADLRGLARHSEVFRERALAEIVARETASRGNSVVESEPHRLQVAGSIPAPATSLKGRWDS